MSDLTLLPSVPEAALSEAVAATLPEATPAPWTVGVQAVLWWHRAAPDATRHLPDGLRRTRVLPLTIGGLIRYVSSPVGPYDEVLGSPVVLLGGGPPAVHVPFLAVDSPASLCAGRANWGLPKILGRFDWSRGPDAPAGGGLTVTAAGGEGATAWSVAARVRRRARRRTVSLSGHDRQLDDAGRLLRTRIHIHGDVQLGRVEIATTGPTLPAWLRAGSHAAIVVPEGRAVIAAPD